MLHTCRPVYPYKCSSLSELSGKEPHRQVGVGMAVISGSTECKRYRFDSCSRRNVSDFYHLRDTCYRDKDPVQLMRCLVVEPTLCIHIK